MELPEPEPGLVIGYSYLWRREQLKGQEGALPAGLGRAAVAVEPRDPGHGDLAIHAAMVPAERAETGQAARSSSVRARSHCTAIRSGARRSISPLSISARTSPWTDL